MGDYPLEDLGGKTPLEAARTPNMDKIASVRIGMARTIPKGMEPGSDVANLSLMGYDPRTYHTGRSPLEAASMGIELQAHQVAFRMNLVTLERQTENEIIMKSHSSGDITTGEGKELVEFLKKELVEPDIRLYPGVAYRHLLVWNNGPAKAVTIPPHDVLDQDMASYLNNGSDPLVKDLIRQSWGLLENHVVNLKRQEKGLNPANSIWLWGQGKAPKIPPLRELYGLKGVVISAVDLIKGIGVYAGLTPIVVKGATGYIDTNYMGKARAALESLKEIDFVFLHVEAPDEAGHAGSPEEKIRAIEYFDEKVVGTVLDGLRAFDDFRVMVVSDHLTPIAKRTHTDEPTPFAWAGKQELGKIKSEETGFTEKEAKDSGLFFHEGHTLMQAFIQD
jgi:2,3-bisphosphoglycerate-independent phosphoglycerate mutase